MIAARATFAALAFGLFPLASQAASVVATRVLPAETVLSAADMAVSDERHENALTDPSFAVGLETRVTIYAGRPVSALDLRPPALVERNETVTLSYESGALSIRTEGRALGRGAAGDRVEVMNLASRSIVVGAVAGPSLVVVER